jgi:hypothetical protein
MAKIGRNERCPCGSGKKYKKCHGNSLDEQSPIRRLRDEEIPPKVKLAFERHKAQESIRQQQGFGNPIISAEINGYKIVAGQEVAIIICAMLSGCVRTQIRLGNCTGFFCILFASQTSQRCLQVRTSQPMA